jgi:hypothetical protein
VKSVQDAESHTMWTGLWALQEYASEKPTGKDLWKGMVGGWVLGEACAAKLWAPM